MHICGVVVSAAMFNRGRASSIHREATSMSHFCDRQVMGERTANLLLLSYGVLPMFWLNPWSARGSLHHAGFMGNWPTIIDAVLALSTQWMRSPSRKWGRMVIPRFHLVVFVFGVIQGKWGAGGVQYSPMMGSFSADLPAIGSCWTETHLEFYRTSTTEFPCESMWRAFRWLG